MSTNFDRLTVNTIRTLVADAVQKANSGHPGLAIGAAPMALSVFKQMRHNPANPSWRGRDRFVLSAGHASMLEYSLLHLFGYDVSIDDIKNFRQLGSKTAGHPEYGNIAGIEATTGPLGQGFAMAVGMAILEPMGVNHIFGGVVATAIAVLCEAKSFFGHFFYLHGVTYNDSTFMGFAKAFIVALAKRKSEDMGAALEESLNEEE